MLISHRGNDEHNYKENTIDAIVFSLNKDYIDGVEFDIQITKDNVIVLNHDFKYNNYLIKDTNYDLLKLDKLEDLLNKLDTKKLLFIEIKSEKFDKNFVDELHKLLIKYNHLNIKICSFNSKILKYIKRNYSYECALIIGEKKNRFRFINKFDYNSVKYIYLNKCKKIDFMWTVNNIELFNKIDKNIHIISDVPYKLKNTN